jgi:hypothetical protein
MDSCTLGVDGCSSAIVFSPFIFLLFFFSGRFHVSAPFSYSIMCAIGCLLSIVPHAGEILLEMLAIDSYWELDTVQLLKHICVFGQDLVNSLRPMPIWRPFSISCVLGSQW